MSKKFTDEEIDLNLAKYIYNGAKSFGEGIYVPSNCHPCGWDFINFTYVFDSEDDVEDNVFYGSDISNGYGNEEFSNCTLLEILKKVHGQVAFELNQIDW